MRILIRILPIASFIIAFFIVLTPARATDATVTDCANFTGAGTISQAVDDANNGGGTISITCTGNIIFNTELVISADVTLNNASGGEVRFVGDNNTRFFKIDASLTLNGFAMRNGRSSDGGAILNNGTLTITNSTFVDNSADIGGAILNNGTVTITDSTFIGNSAAMGGAIRNNNVLTITDSSLSINTAQVSGGAIFNNGTLTIATSTISANSAPSGSAIFNDNSISSQGSHYANNTCGGNGTITDNGGNTVFNATGCPDAIIVNPPDGAPFNVCSLDEFSAALALANTNNRADVIHFSCNTTLNFTTGFTILEDGGNGIVINNNGFSVIFHGQHAVQFFRVKSSASLALDGILLQNGRGSSGGAIENDGTLTITNSSFSSNKASIGGAIKNNGSLTISDSRFGINSASYKGGAIHNTGILTIVSSIFLSNVAQEEGGAIFSSGGLTITNSTFTTNSAELIGGALSIDQGVITNSIFRSNSAFGGSAIFNRGDSISSQGTFYSNNTCLGGTSPIIDNGDNTAVNATGCPGLPLVRLALSAPTCNPTTNSMEFDILSGDGRTFAVTGTGPDVPNTMTIGTNTLPAQTSGTNTWALTIREIAGDRQSLQISITCSVDADEDVDIDAVAVCDGDNLMVEILAGDLRFDIADARGILLSDIPLGIHTIPGPISTQDLRVSERGGNRQTVSLGDLMCGVVEPPDEEPPNPNITLSASAVCLGNDLQVSITGGDAPFNINYGLGSTSGNPTGVYTFPGPAIFNTVTVTEQGGDLQTLGLGNFNCTRPIVASAVCVGNDLQVSITGGDAPFNINYGLGSTSGNPTGVYTFPGPAIFNTVTVTEQSGDLQTLGLGNFNCTRPIVASAVCAYVDLQVTINDGDGPFTINYGLGSTSGNPTGVYTFPGPAIFNNVTVTEQGGDFQVISLGNINCYFPLIAYAACLGNDLQVVITAGDAPFSIQYGASSLIANVAGAYIIPGPGTFTGVAVFEFSGDNQSLGMGDITCP